MKWVSCSLGGVGSLLCFVDYLIIFRVLWLFIALVVVEGFSVNYHKQEIG